jgi:DNA-binding winged helix-turn-helix (wHTH) protein
MLSTLQTMSIFAPFRLDLANEQLWRGREVIRLRPKTFAVLRCLTASAGQLVTKNDLLASVWPETTVSEAALTVCIGELCHALQDHARTPQFIETVHRRGYRFIAAVTPAQDATETIPPTSSSQVVSSVPRSPVPLLGREAELTLLHEWLARALRGERQVGFITGEAGMGKTTLVDTFVAQVAYEYESTCLIGHGQCIEHYGTGEAYLPLLEALGRLCRSPQGQHLIDILHHQAPSWLLQMPGLLSANEYAALRQQSPNATRERMLRELTEAVDTLTAAHPLVLVLEDLHWSDVFTYDWLVYVARRRDPARLLVLGTYRPLEAMAHPHPLHTVTQDLQLHGQVMGMDLSDLSEEEVGFYLRQRLGQQSLSDALAPLIHQRTSGNPLFMVTVVDMFVQRGGAATGKRHVGARRGD